MSREGQESRDDALAARDGNRFYTGLGQPEGTASQARVLQPTPAASAPERPATAPATPAVPVRAAASVAPRPLGGVVRIK